MRQMFRHRPSPAMVVAVIALIVAMSGTGYAALTITGKNVRNGSLTGADVRNNTLASIDVKNGNLLAKDFKAGQLPAGPQGAQGPQGPQGPQGAQGVQGPADGPAGGDLSGFYPNPLIADDAVTNPKLADNSVNSANVADNSLTSADIGELSASEIPDGSLNAADIAKAAGVSGINFGSIPAGSCAGTSVFPGVSPDGEAILVTPSEQIDNNGTLAISAQDSNVAGAFAIKACNVTGAPIDPPAANFSWLVFDN
jgi:hypothetical protein